VGGQGTGDGDGGVEALAAALTALLGAYPAWATRPGPVGPANERVRAQIETADLEFDGIRKRHLPEDRAHTRA
jgi:hypothetical protein